MHFCDGMEGDKMVMKAQRCFESQVLILSNTTVTQRMSTQQASLILYYLIANKGKSVQMNTTYETRY